MKQVKVKLPKGVNQEFLDSTASMGTDELKATIVLLQVQNQENEAFKETEGYTTEADRFELAKERFQQVSGPVKETSVSIKNKTKLVVERLKEKGQV